jgi:hypothetical protein
MTDLRQLHDGAKADRLHCYSDMPIAYPKGVPPWIKSGTAWSPGTDFVTVDGMPAVHLSG